VTKINAALAAEVGSRRRNKFFCNPSSSALSPTAAVWIGHYLEVAKDLLEQPDQPSIPLQHCAKPEPAPKNSKTQNAKPPAQ
jgi:hypothetical protein